MSDIKQLIEKDYQLKTKKFLNNNIKYPYILLGDSMAAYLNLSLFNFTDMMNQGIAGDTTLGVLNRLDAVIQINPKLVFLNIGSNDLVLTDLTIDQSIDNIIAIKARIEEKTDAIVYVFSMTPVLRDHEISNMTYIGKRDNPTLKKINHQLISKMDEKYILHIYDELLDSHHQLNKAYTTDGIHLNKQGYEKYSAHIKRIIDTHTKGEKS